MVEMFVVITVQNQPNTRWLNQCLPFSDDYSKLISVFRVLTMSHSSYICDLIDFSVPVIKGAHYSHFTDEETGAQSCQRQDQVNGRATVHCVSPWPLCGSTTGCA